MESFNIELSLDNWYEVCSALQVYIETMEPTAKVSKRQALYSLRKITMILGDLDELPPPDDVLHYE